MKDENKSAIEGAVQNLAPALGAWLTTILTLFGASPSPVWPILLGSAHGLFGYYLYYKQDKLTAFVTWLRDHPKEFAEEIVRQPAFQSGFFPTLDAYLRARNEEKARLVQQVFLGFAQDKDKDRFELERFYTVIQTISYEGLEYLRFFNEIIFPEWEKYIEKESRRLKWPRKLTEEHEPISKYITKWIYDNYDPNSPIVKERWGYHGSDIELAEKIWAEKEPHDDRLKEAVAEYLSLGIFRTIPGTSGAIGGGGTPPTHTFTDFGWKFFRYFQKMPS